MHKPELILLGGPNSGKTHYAGQLYGRLQRRPGMLRIRKDEGTPIDLSALQEVLECLENGRSADHTAADTWAEIILPIIDINGTAFDIHWPDYGGEQLRSVFTNRAVADTWRLRLEKAEGWMLLIRLTSETTYTDALAQLAKRESIANNMEVNPINGRARNWDANAQWIELLQILLHVSKQGNIQKIKNPKLAILLSCYDELAIEDSHPADILATRLPLFSAFLHANWQKESLSIWGLSALGQALEKDKTNDDFANDAPEYQGWIVTPDSQDRDSDITLPLAWLLKD